MSVSEFINSRPKEVAIFLEAKREMMEFNIEQHWDYVRHIGLYTLMPYSEKKLRPSDVKVLKRDGKILNLTPFQRQELDKWSDECDDDMKNFKPNE